MSRFCIRSIARFSNGHRSALLPVVDGRLDLRLGDVGVGATAVPIGVVRTMTETSSP